MEPGSIGSMKLPEQTTVLTAIVGSYPKPRAIYAGSGRELLSSDSFELVAQGTSAESEAFDALLDSAVRGAIDDQAQAGLDIISDGEERRAHYVHRRFLGRALVFRPSKH